MRERTNGERLILPAALTAIAIAIGAVFGISLGTTAAVLYAMMLPVPLLLLWLSWDVKTLEERLAAAEPAPARARPARALVQEPAHA